jgi:transposase-like protein
MAGFVSFDGLFAGRHFDREIIILCVRWYLRFKLSFLDLVEMMAERGLPLAHTTIMRWVRHYAPEFERRWNRFARRAGGWMRPTSRSGANGSIFTGRLIVKGERWISG